MYRGKVFKKIAAVIVIVLLSFGCQGVATSSETKLLLELTNKTANVRNLDKKFREMTQECSFFFQLNDYIRPEDLLNYFPRSYLFSYDEATSNEFKVMILAIVNDSDSSTLDIRIFETIYVDLDQEKRNKLGLIKESVLQILEEVETTEYCNYGAKRP